MVSYKNSAGNITIPMQPMSTTLKSVSKVGGEFVNETKTRTADPHWTDKLSWKMIYSCMAVLSISMIAALVFSVSESPEEMTVQEQFSSSGKACFKPSTIRSDFGLSEKIQEADELKLIPTYDSMREAFVHSSRISFVIPEWLPREKINSMELSTFFLGGDDLTRVERMWLAQLRNKKERTWELMGPLEDNNEKIETSASILVDNFDQLLDDSKGVQVRVLSAFKEGEQANSVFLSDTQLCVSVSHEGSNTTFARPVVPSFGDGCLEVSSLYQTKGSMSVEFSDSLLSAAESGNVNDLATFLRLVPARSMGLFDGTASLSQDRFVLPEKSRALEVLVNFRGASLVSQRWRIQVKISERWIDVWSNKKADSWTWNLLSETTPMPSIADFESQGEIRFRIVSDNSLDAADFDLIRFCIV